MPIYEYQNADAHSCPHCEQGFERLHKSGEQDLAACPKCGAAVKKKLSAPSLAGAGPSLDPANLEKHGFTQFRKSGKGVYEKTAGKGPDVISDD